VKTTYLWKKGLLPFRPRRRPRYAGSFEYEHEDDDDDDEDDQEPDTDKGKFRASGCLARPSQRRPSHPTG